MSKTKTARKTAYFLACLLGAAYLVASCSSEDTAPIVADEFVSITGTINNLDDKAEPGVAIEGVYGSPGDALNPVTESNINATNNFSLTVLPGAPFYLHATKDTFATINTARTKLSASITADPVGIPTVDQAQLVIDTAFGVGIVGLQDFAWLVVDVVDASGDGVIGKTISIQSKTLVPLGEVYTACDGTDSLVNETTGPCPAGRLGPMYIAYFDSEAEVDITVGGEKQTAPIRKGEIAVLEIEVAANEFFTISGTVTNLTNTAAEAGVEVEAVYTAPGGAYNPTATTDVNGDYSLQVLKNEEAFLKFSKGVDYATVNTLKLVLNENLPGVDIDISLPSRNEAQGIINTAFALDPQLGDHAWLMADVLGGSGVVERGDEIIQSSSCDPGIRVGPMYIAYFDSDAEASVSVTNVIQTAPLRMNEITYLVFKPEPTGP
jgi:hypothetical protein